MNDAGGASIFTEPRLYMDMVILYLYTTIFAMLFDVCAMLYCPFGPRDFDIKHDVVGKGIRHLAVSLSEGHLPPTIDSENDAFIESPSSMLAVAELNLRRRVKGSNNGNTLRRQWSVATRVETANVMNTVRRGLSVRDVGDTVRRGLSVRSIGNGSFSFLPSFRQG